ncbi:MAG: serine hydrolase domain-containing protein [Bacteroidota bacterium]
MKALTKLSFVFLFILVMGCGRKEHKIPVTKTFVERTDSLFATVPDFSGVALVADKGKAIYHKAFGYRNFETKVPMDTASIFELASVSKQFTAMIIMMLKEEGKLEYDDLVEKYLPGLPYKQITIRQLLTHTSGLPDYQKIMDEHWDKTKVAGNTEILEYLKKYHPGKQFEPGEKYEYSNTGYVLLGSIAEKASGKDFVEFCRDRIFKPLSMSSTDIRTLEEKEEVTNFALGHIYVMEKQRYVSADSFPASNYIMWLGNRKGPGRISSTASDLLKWDRALYTENLIKKITLEEAFAPMKLNSDSLSNYGFGWEIETTKPGKVVRHSGDNPGYKTHIIRYIDADKTVILLCNNAPEKYKKILKGIEGFIE